MAPKNDRRLVLVLWDDQFDETAAVVVTTELRAAGLEVWLVGLYGGAANGRFGVRLGADATLSEACAARERIVCVVLPAPLSEIGPAQNDPRLEDLLGWLAQRHVTIVAQNGHGSQVASRNLPADAARVPAFARRLGRTLTQQSAVPT